MFGDCGAGHQDRFAEGVEAVRACRRLGDDIADAAEASLANLALVPMDEDLLAVA
ncbi:MAG: hypothetical protein ACOYBY_18125 [Dermatophilaceae bacterium]